MPTGARLRFSPACDGEDGVSLYVALNNIFGGSCEINPGNFLEFYAQSVMLLLGSSVWAYVIGSACGIVATLDPAT